MSNGDLRVKPHWRDAIPTPAENLAALPPVLQEALKGAPDPAFAVARCLLVDNLEHRGWGMAQPIYLTADGPYRYGVKAADRNAALYWLRNRLLVMAWTNYDGQPPYVYLTSRVWLEARRQGVLRLRGGLVREVAPS